MEVLIIIVCMVSFVFLLCFITDNIRLVKEKEFPNPIYQITIEARIYIDISKTLNIFSLLLRKKSIDCKPKYKEFFDYVSLFSSRMQMLAAYDKYSVYKILDIENIRILDPKDCPYPEDITQKIYRKVINKSYNFLECKKIPKNNTEPLESFVTLKMKYFPKGFGFKEAEFCDQLKEEVFEFAQCNKIGPKIRLVVIPISQELCNALEESEEQSQEIKEDHDFTENIKY